MCAARSIRAMPETEIPPAMRVHFLPSESSLSPSAHAPEEPPMGAFVQNDGFWVDFLCKKHLFSWLTISVNMVQLFYKIIYSKKPTEEK